MMDGGVRIQKVGIIGYGYVGHATGYSLSQVAEVSWHDPKVTGSRSFNELARWADALFVCVPTPRGETGAADLGVVREVVSQLAGLRITSPILLKSTVPPGTTEGLARSWPTLAMVCCPEFLRESTHIEDASAPARVVLGWSSTASESTRALVRDLYVRRFPSVPRVELPSLAAEFLKYASNALFGVKVSFANEMAELARRVGVDWEAVRSALVLDSRVGDGHLAVPGPDGRYGFGGSCLPKDLAGLLAVAAALNVELEVVASAVHANRRWRGTEA
ncbi:MAG: UDP-glucose/GDP-mannose dehydrogenase family protein [Myxococcales bacterium]|nr:UDP-glucose/GDP-mannose dehydrogenase family protein [Myxococcales bacterium]